MIHSEQYPSQYNTKQHRKYNASCLLTFLVFTSTIHSFNWVKRLQVLIIKTQSVIKIILWVQYNYAFFFFLLLPFKLGNPLTFKQYMNVCELVQPPRKVVPPLKWRFRQLHSSKNTHFCSVLPFRCHMWVHCCQWSQNHFLWLLVTSDGCHRV